MSNAEAIAETGDVATVGSARRAQAVSNMDLCAAAGDGSGPPVFMHAVVPNIPNILPNQVC
jgi:hypothetical protein